MPSGFPVSSGSGGGVITSSTAGYISYYTAATTINGSANHFWDNTNARLGLGTASPSDRLTINAGNIVATGTFGSGDALSIAGAGTRMIWYPAKAAFRAGLVQGTTWDDANIGNYSFACGRSTTASQNYSSALGDGATASGATSFAQGGSNTASAQYGAVIGGNSNTNSGLGAIIAAGLNNTLSGQRAIILAGEGVTSQSYASIFGGQFNALNATGTTSSWISTDPLFVLGNGVDTGTRTNALVLLKNGKLGVNPGSSSPSTELHVFGATTLGGAVTVSGNLGMGANTLNVSNINTNSGNITINAGSGNNLLLQTSSTTRVTISDATGGIVMGSGATVRLASVTSGTGTGLIIDGSGDIRPLTSTPETKENIQDLEFDVDQFLGIIPKTYDYKDAAIDRESAGFLTTNLIENGFPQLVSFDLENKPFSIKHFEMIPYMFKVLKEERDESKFLRFEVESLRNELKELKASL